VILNFLILNCTRFYNSPGGGSSNNSSFSDVLNSLCNGLVNLTGGEHGTLSNLTASNSNVYTGLTSFLDTNDIAHTGYPKAYINWIFLDDQFNYVSSLSGSVLAASSTYPAGSLNMVAPGGPIALNKSGYLYIWVSNETTGWDVYYDNLSVQYKQGPLDPPNVPEYVAPKSGDRKVQNPNGSGSGWVDRNGHVWVPNDNKGNHAPHWDVQDPKNGTYENVYPSVSTTIQVGVGVAILAGIWEGVKWTVAVIGAPESGGVSLGLLAIP
jgi:hypothetical protein